MNSHSESITLEEPDKKLKMKKMKEKEKKRKKDKKNYINVTK